MLVFTCLIRAAAGLLVSALALASPARAQTCFFADDYSNPARWTQLNTGISVANGGVQVTNTSGGSTPSVQRGIFQPLPQPLPNGGGWRLELTMNYGNVGASGGLMIVAVAAGTQQPFNVSPGGTQIRTPQDCIGLISTGTLGARPVPLSLFVSDNGTWNQSPPLNLRLNAVTYLRLERLNTGMLKMSAFEDAARTIHQSGSPVCYIPQGQYTNLGTVWHANLPQGSDTRNDQATLDNLCLSTIPVLDTTFTASVSRTRICLGQPLTLTAPNPDYDPVVWSTTTPAGASWAGSGPSVTYTPPVAGTYTFTANGTLTRFCDRQRLRQFTVEVVPQDVAAVSYPQAVFCRTGTAAVGPFAPAGGTFSGSAGLVVNATTGLINLAASAPGPHTVTYTSAGFCPATATFSLIITPLDVTSVAYGRTAFCRTGSTAVPTRSPMGGTFAGTPGLVIDPAMGVINLATSGVGPHTVTYTSAGPCPTAATFALRIDPLDVASLVYVAPAFCLTGFTPPPAVAPAGGQFTGTAGLVLSATTGVVNLAASAPGPHTVTYISAGPCPDTATFALIIRPLDVTRVAYAQNAFCRVGGTVAPTASPAGGTFTGTPGLMLNAMTGVIDPAASVPGPHTVTYTSGGPCPTTATFALTINSLDVATVAYPQVTYCATGFTPPPTVSPAGGQFTGTAGLVLNAITGVVSLAASAPGPHTVTYRSGGRCPATATFALTILRVDVVTVSYAQTTYCGVGSTAPPVVSPAGGSFSGLPGLALNPTTGVVNLAATTPGTYTVTYSSVGTCAQTATFTFRVDRADVAAVSYAQATYCATSSTTAPVVSPAGGTFSGTAGLVLNAATGVVDLGASVPGPHTVTYTSGGICPATAAFALTINRLDVVTLTYQMTSLCEIARSTAPSRVSPPGGHFSYSTFGPSILGLDPISGIIIPTASGVGTFTVTYTSAGLCPDSATATITITRVDVVSIRLPDSVYCQAGTTPAPVVLPAGGQFRGTPGLVFDLQTGIVDLARTPVGRYALEYATTGPCAGSATMPLRIRPRGAAAIAYADTTFCPGGTSAPPRTQPAGGGIFTGTTGLVVDEATGVIDLAASAQGPHTVTFTAADRCFDPATTRLTVGVPLENILPNIITPNRDGFNETFGLPTPLPTVSAYELMVFNRWGTRVYRSTDSAAPWAGADVSAGSYFYQMRFTDCAGRARRYKGVVEVVR